tara:strand:- start:490 stop:744 length:255 start_codon:yes stop_codon:yes gene_type:complete
MLGGGIDRQTAGDAVAFLKRQCRGNGKVSASAIAREDEQAVVRGEIIQVVEHPLRRLQTIIVRCGEGVLWGKPVVDRNKATTAI